MTGTHRSRDFDTGETRSQRSCKNEYLKKNGKIKTEWGVIFLISLGSPHVRPI